MNQELEAAVAAFSLFAALMVASNRNLPVDAPKRASDGIRHSQATYPLDRKSNALQRDSGALGRTSARLAVLSESDTWIPKAEAERLEADPWVLMSDVERLEAVVLEPVD